MNKVPEKATVTPSQPPETHSKLSEMWWFATTRVFLDIPNPAILKVFVLSSLATFTSGIALAIEWLCHGKSHTGFEWIIYYALFLICLPLLVLIGLRILMAISSSSHGSSQIVESVDGKKPCTDVPEAQPERNSSQSLAVVVASDEKNNIKKSVEEKMPKIKRAVSLPSHGGEVRSCRTR